MSTRREIEEQRNREHTGKTKYATKREAKNGIRRMRSVPAHERRFTEGPTVGHLKPYRCRWCPYWHVGHDLHNKKRPQEAP
jgi:hypothetical protein